MHIMKKTYIVPASQSVEMQCGEMLALSLNDNGGKNLGAGDFEDDGDFEYDASKKGYWESEW